MIKKTTDDQKRGNHCFCVFVCTYYATNNEASALENFLQTLTNATEQRVRNINTLTCSVRTLRKTSSSTTPFRNASPM